MKTINVKTDASTSNVPVSVEFQAALADNFEDREEVIVQLINRDGQKVGDPELRMVVKTHDGENIRPDWYEAYLPHTR